MGLPTEFLTVQRIREEFPPAGPTELIGDPILVTDDTQMTLSVGEALVDVKAGGTMRARDLELALTRELVRWLNSPDNNRAPGRTCMTACERLEHGASWLEATVVRSKGCGANMRVAPVAFLEDELRNPVAQFQAAMTHGHPTALAASDLTAFALARLASGDPVNSLLSALKEHIAEQRATYHGDWLGDLWSQAGAESPQAFIASGWAECATVIDRIEGSPSLAPDEDPCDVTGEGWIAEEALATGLLCFLLNPTDPAAAIRRGAVTCGDSDSIASIAGALAGAHSGMEAWPETWAERIEYRDRLDRLARHLI